MKIKLDFVTNSSSTCYIVVLPSGLQPLTSLDEIKYWDEDGHEEDEALKIINDNIRKLKSGDFLYREDTELFWPVQQYLENEDLILKSIDSAGGDGCDLIESITVNELQAAINRCNNYENKT